MRYLFPTVIAISVLNLSSSSTYEFAISVASCLSLWVTATAIMPSGEISVSVISSNALKASVIVFDLNIFLRLYFFMISRLIRLLVMIVAYRSEGVVTPGTTPVNMLENPADKPPGVRPGMNPNIASCSGFGGRMVAVAVNLFGSKRLITIVSMVTIITFLATKYLHFMTTAK